MGGHNLERERIAKRQKYWDRKSKGLCVKCGKEPSIEHSAMCVDCNYKDYLWRQNRTKNMTDEQRQKRNTALNEWKQRNRDKGLCSCGKPLNDKRYKLCLECRLYFKRKRHEYRPSNKWLELGLCRWCGKETAEGTKYCAKHLEQMRQLCERNFRPNGFNIANSEYFRGLNNAFWKERKSHKIQGESA